MAGGVVSEKIKTRHDRQPKWEQATWMKPVNLCYPDVTTMRVILLLGSTKDLGAIQRGFSELLLGMASIVFASRYKIILS